MKRLIVSLLVIGCLSTSAAFGFGEKVCDMDCNLLKMKLSDAEIYISRLERRVKALENGLEKNDHIIHLYLDAQAQANSWGVQYLYAQSFQTMCEEMAKDGNQCPQYKIKQLEELHQKAFKKWDKFMKMAEALRPPELPAYTD